MHSQKTASGVEKISVVRVADGVRSSAEDFVAVESPLTIVLDNQELVTILCTPVNQKYLAVGFLFSEGFLKAKEEMKKIVLDDRKGLVWVETVGGRQVDADLLHKRLITSGCGRGASFYSFSDIPGSGNVESQVGQVPQQRVVAERVIFCHGDGHVQGAKIIGQFLVSKGPHARGE